jgi:hypothetical protein
MQDTITRAEIDALWHNFTPDLFRFFVETDAAGRYDLVAITPAGLIVESWNSKQLARVVQTGTVPNRHGLLRARLYIARDTGDAEGTLAFDSVEVGAKARVEFFEMAGA